MLIDLVVDVAFIVIRFEPIEIMQKQYHKKP
jgi:hypothetical protein